MEAIIILPIKGSVDQVGSAKNFWRNQWVGNNFEVKLAPFEKISEVLICGHMGKNSPKGITLQVTIDGQPQGELPGCLASSGRVTLSSKLRMRRDLSSS